MRFILLFFLATSLFASLHQKSAIVYYGNNISYSMVGVHDYIIVQPRHVNTYRHGFKVYKDKMYAYVSIGEIDRTVPEYKKVDKSWILAKNKAWNSEVLDLKNPDCVKFIFHEMIEPQIKRGFKNFFFDTLDSYQLASKTKKARAENEKALVKFIREFHRRYPDAKLIVNRGFEVIDEMHDILQAVLFESYYKGIGGKKLAYKDVSQNDRAWLDTHINKIQSYGLDVICVDYMPADKMDDAKVIAKKIGIKGMIPYIANRDLNIYGVSSKNALKREIFILANESRYDAMAQGILINTGAILEYMGYIQKFYDVNKKLPDVNEMRHYAGVIIWLRKYAHNSSIFMQWIVKLKKAGIKIVFVNNFGFAPDNDLLKKLNIRVEKKAKYRDKITKEDKMMGFELEPSLSVSSLQIESKNVKPLLTYQLKDKTTSTPAAITEWGGYAIDDAFMSTVGEDNIWVVNPFRFFKETLRLKPLIVPDTTTENGKRLLFTHIDGDGMMNRVEGNFGYYSGDVILNKILKVYKIPHSVSVIGSEIQPNGLYPKISPALLKIAKEMYALENVEPATHTFTHPFFWNKIKNGDLNKKYRLKPKGYHFSLAYELQGTLDFINENLSPFREAQTVFWSGDCIPRKNALEFVYKHNILNINGGDTTISNNSPWISNIAPAGMMRDGYIQVFTGEQNENVFTNDWLGPFWGYKRVTQTFDLTNSPRRFKPIDIYYHLYSGSKQASLKALKYVFDYAIKQDVMPIFTSEYIPKAMDYYSASLAKDGNEWLVSGLEHLHTIRIEDKNASVDLNVSSSVMGLKHFENHTYLSLDDAKEHFIKVNNNASLKNRSYMISANAKVINFQRDDANLTMHFDGHVDLKINFYVPPNCELSSTPSSTNRVEKDGSLFLNYKGIKEAVIHVGCK